MRALPGNLGAERQAHLRAYLVACIRDNFPTKADLASLGSLRRLRDTLVTDLEGALAGIGLSSVAAKDLAMEAVGGALAKRAAGWLMDKIGGRGAATPRGK